MIRVYFRCTSGHYFAGTHCMLDGWSSPASFEVARACEQLVATGASLSVARLKEAGVSEEALRRTVVIEFGESDSAFELIAPEGYIVDGVWVEQKRFDRRFL